MKRQDIYSYKTVRYMTPQLKAINVKDVPGVHEPKRSHLAECW